jgi:hypothetical protein
MLTIFSTLKPFTGKIKVIQTNALRSWVALRPACEVILFGGEAGTAEIATDLGIRHVADIERNEYGTPLVSAMFQTAQQMARHPLMCFANADIILMSDLLPAVQQITWPSFLLLGQRWDIECEELIDFSDPRWEEQLRARLAKEGKLHLPSGIDYFIFPRGLYTDIPPFAIGRPGWDNWMVYNARSRKLPVIDATKAVTVVHQNHDYAHHPQGTAGVYQGVESEHNLKLLGGWEYSLCTRNANWMLTLHGLKRALTVSHLFYWLLAVPVLVPRLRFLNIPREILIKLSKAIRARLGIPKG